jgi:hypothetical protein
VKERPILFTPDNAQKVHVGSKTQTRRLVKPQPVIEDGLSIYADGNGVLSAQKRGSKWDGFYFVTAQDGNKIKCPYGKIGDRLWVRESFAIVPSTAYRLSEGVQQKANPTDTYWSAVYAAGWTLSPIRMSPSIHMPRWACRTVLEITEIRAERLHEASTEDIWDEGVRVEAPSGANPDNVKFPKDFATWPESKQDEWFKGQARATHMAQLHHIDLMHEAWEELWDSINGVHSWKFNPWVWVLKFKKVNP